MSSRKRRKETMTKTNSDKATKYYYAVRKCISLKSPAIFTCWDDCGVHVDLKAIDGKADCQIFTSILEAMDYIEEKKDDDKALNDNKDIDDDNNDNNDNNSQPSSNALKTAAAATNPPRPDSSPSPAKAAGGKIIIVSSDGPPQFVRDTAGNQEKTGIHLLASASSRKRPPPISSPVEAPRKKRATTKTTAKDGEAKCSSTECSPSEELVTDEEGNKRHNTHSKDNNKHSSEIDSQIQNLPNMDVDEQQQLTQPQQQDSILATQQIGGSTFLAIAPRGGVIINNNNEQTIRRDICLDTQRWESNFALLKAFKTQYGHCRVFSKTSPEFKQMDEKFQGLCDWLTQQRAKKKALLSNKDSSNAEKQQGKENDNSFGSTKQTLLRLQRLDDLMGSLSLGSKFNKFEENLVLLKDYKNKYGDCKVPGPKSNMYRHLDEKFKGLFNWLQQQRSRKKMLLPDSNNSAEEQEQEREQEQQQEQDQEQDQEQHQRQIQQQHQQNQQQEIQQEQEGEEDAPATSTNKDKLFTNVWEMQFQKLEEILGADGYDGHKEDHWHNNYAALLEYKKKNGNLSLPQSNRELRNFAFKMRQHIAKYKADPVAYKKGRRGRWFLDDHKFQKLTEELGLEEASQERQRSKPKFIAVTAKAAPTWNEMFNQLCAFQKEHGHLLVPNKPASLLRNWVVHQRDVFQRLKEQGKGTKKKDTTSSSLLTPERIAKLTSIGFSFHPKERLSWEERAVQWLAYFSKHSRNPPPDFPFLGSWVRRMRRYYHAHQKGEKTPVTQEQFDKLDSWGFTWSMGFKQPEFREPKKSWEERYQQLLDYRAEFGDVKVPQKFPVLGHWVHRQRKEYALMNRGKKSAMNAYRLQKLNEIDFVFLTR